MPAETLGIAGVERRLRVLRRRLNFFAVEDLAYRLGTLLVLAVALLWVLERHASAAQFRLVGCVTIAICAIGAAAAFAKLRRRWMTMEGTARVADRRACLEDRLAALLTHRARSQRSPLGSILLAQVFSLSARWEPHILAPHRVPRSAYGFVASLAVLAFVAAPTRQPSLLQPAPVQTGEAAEARTDGEHMLAFQRLRVMSGEPANTTVANGVATTGGEDLRGSRARAPAGAGGKPAQPDLPSQGDGSGGSHPAEAHSAPGDAERNRRVDGGQGVVRNHDGTARHPAPDEKTNDRGTTRATAPGPRGANDTAHRTENDQARETETAAAPHTDPRRSERAEKGASDNPQPGGSLAAREGSGRAGGLLGERPASTRAPGQGRTFPLKLSASSAAAPTRFEPQRGRSSDEAPSAEIADAVPATPSLGERDVPDAPLHRAEISPEHEAVVRRIFNRK